VEQVHDSLHKLLTSKRAEKPGPGWLEFLYEIQYLLSTQCHSMFDTDGGLQTGVRTDNGTDSQTDTETDPQTETETDSQRETETDSQTVTETDSQTETKTNSQIEIETDSHTDEQTGSQTRTVTDAQIETDSARGIRWSTSAAHRLKCFPLWLTYMYNRPENEE